MIVRDAIGNIIGELDIEPPKSRVRFLDFPVNGPGGYGLVRFELKARDVAEPFIVCHETAQLEYLNSRRDFRPTGVPEKPPERV